MVAFPLIETFPAIPAVGPDGAALIVIESTLASLPVELVAVMVGVDVPAVVGVPVIAPPLDSDRPAGSEPLVTDHVIVASPAAVSVCE